MILKHAFKNIVRNIKLSLLIIGVTFVLFILFYRFVLNMALEQAEIDRMYETIPVRGYINERDNKYIREPIPMEIVNGLHETGFIKNEKLETRYLAYVYKPYGNVSIRFENDSIYIDPYLQDAVYGISNLEDTTLIPKDVKITLEDGYENEDFQGESQICIVPAKIMEQYNLSYGDKISMIGEFIREYYSGDTEEPENEDDKTKKGITFTICGSYEYMNSRDRYDTTSFRGGDYIVPARALLNNIDSYFVNKEVPRDVYYNGVHNISTKAVVYTAEFEFQNTKHLNEFRKYLKEKDLDENTPGISKFAFVLEDGQLSKSVRPLISSLNFKKSMLKLFFFLICIISFFLSLLTTQRKIGYIAIMRSLGASKGKVFSQIFLENVILESIGLLLTHIIVTIKQGSLYTYVPVLRIALYYGMYLFGCIVALLIVIRMSVMEVLTKKE